MWRMPRGGLPYTVNGSVDRLCLPDLCAHAKRLQKGLGAGAIDVSDRAVPQSESIQWLRGNLAPSGKKPKA